MHSQYSDLLWAGLSNEGEGEIFCSHSDRPWGPPYLCAMGTASVSPEVKQPGHGLNHVPLSSAKMKERVELYFTPSLGPYLYIINGFFIRRCLLHVYAFQASNCCGDYQYESDLGDPVLYNKLKVPRHSTKSLKTICASDFLYQTLL